MRNYFFSNHIFGTSGLIGLISLLKFSEHESTINWNYLTPLAKVFHLI